jgi:hypothetical protein
MRLKGRGGTDGDAGLIGMRIGRRSPLWSWSSGNGLSFSTWGIQNFCAPHMHKMREMHHAICIRALCFDVVAVLSLDILSYRILVSVSYPLLLTCSSLISLTSQPGWSLSPHLITSVARPISTPEAVILSSSTSTL